MLVVAVACNGLQTLENQTLPHGPKVCAQGVQHLDARLRKKIPVFHEFGVRSFGERIRHDLRESQTDEQFTPSKKNIFPVGFHGDFQRTRHSFGKRDMVKAMDSQDFFGHVRGAGDVAAVGGHEEVPCAVLLCCHLDVQRGEDGIQPVCLQGCSQKSKEPREIQLDLSIRDQRRGVVLNGAFQFGTSPFLKEMYAPLGRKPNGIGVDTALKAEAGIRVQAVALGGFPDGHRMEPRGFQKHLCRAFGHPAVRPAVHPCQAHGRRCVGDDQIVAMQAALLSIQCHERLLWIGLADHHGAP